jgi:hypothetical protein
VELSSVKLMMADGGNSELGVRNEKSARKPGLPAGDDRETERRGCVERRDRNVRNAGTTTKQTSRIMSRRRRIVVGLSCFGVGGVLGRFEMDMKKRIS